MNKRSMIVIIVLVFLFTSCKSLKQGSIIKENTDDKSKSLQLNTVNIESIEKAIDLLNVDLSYDINSKDILRSTGEKGIIETLIEVNSKYESSSGIRYKKTKVVKGQEEQYSEIYTDAETAYIKYNDNNLLVKSLDELKNKFDMDGKKTIIDYLENIKSNVKHFSLEEKNDICIYTYINSEETNLETEFLSFIFNGQVPNKTDSVRFEDFKCRCEIYKDTDKVKSIEVFLKYNIDIDGSERVVESERIYDISSFGAELKLVLPAMDTSE